MAIATRIEIPPKPVEPDVKFVLELTPEEAETLVILSGCVGGNPSNTRRKHTNAICNALLATGIQRPSFEKTVKTHRGSIWFNPEEGI